MSAIDDVTQPIEAHPIETTDGLRELYPQPGERAALKCLPSLDAHCRSFIALSPLVMVGTSTSEGADVSPRGDAPGFVQVLDDRTLMIPDRPGNNRIDTMSNLMANPQIGLLFMIPGVNETLRVNGVARISTDQDHLERGAFNGRLPKTCMIVDVREAYLHCGKALIRSKLWHEESKIERSRLPTLGEMVNDQVKHLSSTPMTNEQANAWIEESYSKRLY